VETSSIAATPILYLSNGAQYVLPAVTLPPGGISTVDINAALQSQGIAPYAPLFGYVEVQYSWPWDALCATVRNVDPAHSELFNFGVGAAQRSSPAAPSVPIEGMWWKQEPNVTAFVALTNLSSGPLTVTLQSTDSANNPLAQHIATVSSRGTVMVTLAELQAAPTSHGGLSVTYDGFVGDLVVNGGLEDPAVGYSANIRFASSGPLTAKPFADYAELGLMTGAASPMMNFPAGTAFTPYSLVRNVSGQSVSVTPTVWWMSGGTPHSAQLQAVTIPPYHSTDLDAAALVAGAGLASFSGSINLVLDVHAPQRSLVFASGSVDLKNTYVFAVTPVAIKESVAKTLSYWSTGKGDDTMVTLWNPADQAHLTKAKGPPYPSGTVSVRGGQVYDAQHALVEVPAIRLVLRKIVPVIDRAVVRYTAEVVLTYTGDAPISIPVGTDTDTLLAPAQHDRNALVFTTEFSDNPGQVISAAESASSSDHPESQVTVWPGDSVLFLVPLGSRARDDVPTGQVRVSMHRERKVVDGGTDWTESVGHVIQSENTLPLPPPPAARAGR